jgi:tetratricopeptide (TPR) repeat protein
LNAAVARDPGYAPAHRALAEHLLRSLGSGACSDAADCERRALGHAGALSRANPASAEGVDTKARILSAAGRREEAKQALRAACPRFTGAERIRCLNRRFALARETLNESRTEFLAIADELLEEACSGAGACDKALLEIGDRLAAADEWLHALSAYHRASRENPSAVTLLRLGNALASLKRYSHAEDVLARALRMAERDPALAERIRQKRASVSALRMGQRAGIP